MLVSEPQQVRLIIILWLIDFSYLEKVDEIPLNEGFTRICPVREEIASLSPSEPKTTADGCNLGKELAVETVASLSRIKKTFPLLLTQQATLQFGWQSTLK